MKYNVYLAKPFPKAAHFFQDLKRIKITDTLGTTPKFVATHTFTESNQMYLTFQTGTFSQQCGV